MYLRNWVINLFVLGFSPIKRHIVFHLLVALSFLFEVGTRLASVTALSNFHEKPTFISSHVTFLCSLGTCHRSHCSLKAQRRKRQAMHDPYFLFAQTLRSRGKCKWVSRYADPLSSTSEQRQKVSCIWRTWSELIWGRWRGRWHKSRLRCRRRCWRRLRCR